MPKYYNLLSDKETQVGWSRYKNGGLLYPKDDFRGKFRRKKVSRKTM